MKKKLTPCFHFCYFWILNEMVYIHHFEITSTSVAFHINTSHLFCSANKITGFYVKRNNIFTNADLSFVKTIL